MNQHEIVTKRSAELYLMAKEGLSLDDCEEFVIIILADSIRIKK